MLGHPTRPSTSHSPSYRGNNQYRDERYPEDLSSIPRVNQAAWLDRPSTPLVLGEVFNRRKNLVTSDLHVLLVTADKSERVRMRADLEGLGYKTTAGNA